MTTTENVHGAAWAWVAGLFEGEGSAVNYLQIGGPNAGRRNRMIVISSTDRDVLEQAQSIWGAGTIRADVKEQPDHYKQAYKLTVSKWADSERIARAMYRWLGSRRRGQVDNFLAYPPQAQVRAPFGNQNATERRAA